MVDYFKQYTEEDMNWLKGFFLSLLRPKCIEEMSKPIEPDTLDYDLYPGHFDEEVLD